VWATLNNINPKIELPLETTRILRALTWDHSKGRLPPEHWFSTIADEPNDGPVRGEINNLIEEVLR
jgi:acetoin utilization protein AcuC